MQSERPSQRGATSGPEGYDQSNQTARAFANAISRPWSIANSRSRQHWRSPRRCRRRSLQVILVDANILIYAHVSSFAQHPVARDWLDQQLNGSGPVGLPWPSIVAFLRLVTNPRIFEHPESIGDAWRQVHAWLACETAWIPQPTERHAELLGEFLVLPGMHGNLVPDAHLAALAVEHGLTLCSTDGDFARFRGLRWLNPIPVS